MAVVVRPGILELITVGGEGEPNTMLAVVVRPDIPERIIVGPEESNTIFAVVAERAVA